MRKGDVIAEAVEAIPLWLAFLDRAEKEQQKMLQEIQQAAQADREMPVTTNSPLDWLDHTAPPPKDEAQAPVTAVLQPSPEVGPAASPPLGGDDDHLIDDDDAPSTNDEAIPPWEKD